MAPSPLESRLQGCPVALTIDDAPSVRDGGAPGDPGRMTRVREALVAAGVEHCVAFVIGASSKGHEDVLRAWLDAGFELGNHTNEHRRCSAEPAARFLDDVRRCDDLLDRVGAFGNGRPRYFRFPFLDRGRFEERELLREELAAMGYTVVHGSIDWFDYHYDARLAAAAREGAPPGEIEQRYVEVAVGATTYELDRSRRGLRRDAAHIAYCHFGEATARGLPRILAALGSAGLQFVSVADAMGDPMFTAFDQACDRNGRVPPALFARGVLGAATRAVARLSIGAGLFGQRRLGPRWPWCQE